MRRLLACIVLVLVPAASADAATLSRETGAVLGAPVLSYVASAGEANALRFDVGSNDWLVRDDPAAVTAKDPCGTGDGYTTFEPFCPSSGLVGVEISLGDRDDSADLTRVPGRSVVVGGPGRDHIVTGAGADIINVRDGEADTVDCGAGTDTIVADAIDTLASDCERETASAGKPRVTLTSKPQRAAAVRRHGLKLRITAGTAAVHVTLLATLPRAAAHRLGLGRQALRAATKELSLKPSGSRTLRLKLSKSIRRRLGRGRSRIVLTAMPLGADGSSGPTAHLTVPVRP